MNFFEQWEEVPDNERLREWLQVQWEDFIRHVVADTPWHHELVEGAKGVQLAELGMKSWRNDAGSTCPTSRFRGLSVPTSRCRPRSAARTLRHGRRRSSFRRRRRRSASIASPMRRRMWWLIRSPTSTRGTAPPSTGSDHRVSALSVGPRPRRRRSDGHGAARHGARLARGQELIGHALDAAKTRPGATIGCGAGTDHLDARADHASTTSSAPMRSRSKPSRRSAAASS